VAQDFDKQREKGEAYISLFMRLRAKGVEDMRLFAALEQTPRAAFIDPKYRRQALDNGAFPLECGEYIERLDEQAQLIAALNLEPKHRVLEVGSGSGFTAALLGRLALRVTGLERYKMLADGARLQCRRLGLSNVVIRHADALAEPRGSGPYDRIIVWPAVAAEPAQLIDLLAGNGVLLAPIGPAEEQQTIIRYAKTGSRFETRELFKVRYGPICEGLAAFL